MVLLRGRSEKAYYYPSGNACGKMKILFTTFMYFISDTKNVSFNAGCYYFFTKDRCLEIILLAATVLKILFVFLTSPTRYHYSLYSRRLGERTRWKRLWMGKRTFIVERAYYLFLIQLLSSAANGLLSILGGLKMIP
jgi:hypothetical protein